MQTRSNKSQSETLDSSMPKKRARNVTDLESPIGVADVSSQDLKPSKRSKNISSVESLIDTPDTSDTIFSQSKRESKKITASRQSLPVTPAPRVEISDFQNILTPENKRLKNFKFELAKLSRTDAHHDLKEVFKNSMYTDDQKVRAAFDSGIPYPASEAYHEDEAFAAVMISADTNGNTILINGPRNLSEALNSVPDCTAEYNPNFSLFDIGVLGSSIFKYKVVRFVTQCSNNVNFSDEDLTAIACKSDFGKKFVENVRLGEDGREAAIVVDFSQHHFIEDLTSGTSTDFQVHYLMTPEVVNDPAGKPNVNNRSLFDVQDSGVRLKSYVQTDIDPTTYTCFDESDPSPSNNFFSNYDFTLSPIKQIFTKQKAEKLITTLNIKYDIVPGKPLTDTIEDSKGENSITTVLGYLRKLIGLVKVKNDNAAKFNFNSKIQQKRGGDWFQALCCIDARNRNITEILPTRGSPTKLSPNCPVYLVTHDRIAVSFALLNGVNVIYIDYYGRIFIFKNAGDITLKSSGKPMEQILFEGIKTKWDPNNRSAEQLSSLLTTATKYTADRKAYLDGDARFEGKLNNFYNKCDEIKGSVDAFSLKGKTQLTDFKKISASSVQQMFTMAVELEFIKINLVDVENDIKFIESNREMFGGEYTDEMKTLVANFSKALNNIKGIQDRFGVIPAQADFFNAFNNWVISNVQKLDVYKCSKKLLEGLIPSGENKLFEYNRLSTFYNNSKSREGERTTDSHIFLPFIQNLDDTSRDKLLDILLSLTHKLEEYIVISKSTASSRFLRTIGLSVNEIFYNSLANLIYESFVFIERSKATTPEAINPIFEKTESLIDISMSTDNVLLRVDKMELDILRKTGKQSNYTGDVVDNSASSKIGGGYLDSFSNTSPYARNPESVICDVSVKQITWPLLTCVLLKNSNQESINEFIDQIRQNIPDIISSSEDELSELQNNPIIVSLRDKLSSSYAALSSSLGGRRSRGGGVNPKTYKAIIDLNNLLSGLYSSQDKTTTGKNLMMNFKLGFHPLTPIYAMLTSYYNTLGPKSSSDPFFYTYFTYINVLEKMKSILETRYLNNNSNPYKAAAAYLIGMGLSSMLLKSHTSTAQHKEILNVVGMTKKDFSTFSLKNDSFTSVFAGAFHQDSDEEMFGMICLNNKLFNNFITNEVNIKQVLEQGTSVINLPNYNVLKEKIFKLMDEIVVKVNSDRGTPLSFSIPISPALQAERIARSEQKQQSYQENLAKGLIKPEKKTGITYGRDIFTYSPEVDKTNMVASTTSSQGTRSRGGKKRKITRKRRNVYRIKTVKRHKKNKKTRKHRRH